MSDSDDYGADVHPKDKSIADTQSTTARRQVMTASLISMGRSQGQMIDMNHPSYHLTITSEEAERRLKKSGNHCYLTRFSEGNNCYVLSVFLKRPYQMRHFNIIFEDSGQGRKYRIVGAEEEHNSLDEMLVFYQTNPIDHGFLNIGQRVTREEWEQRWKCSLL